MDTSPSLTPPYRTDESVVVDSGRKVDNRTPLLAGTASTDETKPLEERWRPESGFVWIEIGPVHLTGVCDEVRLTEISHLFQCVLVGV